MCNNRQYVVYIVCATTMHETVGKTQLTYMVSATMALNIGSIYVCTSGSARDTQHLIKACASLVDEVKQ